MKPIIEKYKCLLNDKKYLISIAIAITLLILSILANYYGGMYATEKAAGPVTDIILNNIPVFDVDGIFFYGPFVFWVFVIFLSLKEPRRLPFILKSVAVFVIVRSIFIILTHIGPFPDQAAISPPHTFFEKLMFGGDLFFSGHTGLPFLIALIFGKNKRLFVLFTAAAVFFGVIVLLAHLHYSIDVLAAFFITYTIYHITSWLFKKDKEMFEQTMETPSPF
jgi:membrane-associated phospholipid phosphatase